MNKITIVLFCLALTVLTVSANKKAPGQTNYCPTGRKEVAKYEVAKGRMVREKGEDLGCIGGTRSLSWKANHVCHLVVKSSIHYKVYNIAGKTSFVQDDKHDISHVRFCDCEAAAEKPAADPVVIAEETKPEAEAKLVAVVDTEKEIEDVPKPKKGVVEKVVDTAADVVEKVKELVVGKEETPKEKEAKKEAEVEKKVEEEKAKVEKEEDKAQEVKAKEAVKKEEELKKEQKTEVKEAEKLLKKDDAKKVELKKEEKEELKEAVKANENKPAPCKNALKTRLIVDGPCICNNKPEKIPDDQLWDDERCAIMSDAVEVVINTDANKESTPITVNEQVCKSKCGSCKTVQVLKQEFDLMLEEVKSLTKLAAQKKQEREAAKEAAKKAEDAKKGFFARLLSRADANQEASTSSNNSMKIGAIVGSVLGAALIAAVVVAFSVVRKRRRNAVSTADSTTAPLLA